MKQPEVVVGSASPSKQRGVGWRLKTLLTALRHRAALDIIVAIIVLGGLLIWYHFHNAHKLNSPATNVSYIAQVNQLIREGKYQDAQNLLDQHQTTKAKNAALYNDNLALEAQIQQGEKKYKQALATYESQAQQYGLSPGLATTIGNLAEANHDNQTAITYFSKALALWKAAPQITAVKTQESYIQNQLDLLQKQETAKK